MRKNGMPSRAKLGIVALALLTCFFFLMLESEGLSEKNEAAEDDTVFYSINPHEKIANQFLRSWQYDSAMRHFNIALAECEEAGNWRGVVRMKWKLASAMSNYAKDYANAMETINEGLAIAKARLSPYDPETAYCLHYRAHIFSAMMLPDSAIAMYRAALRIGEHFSIAPETKAEIVYFNTYWLSTVYHSISDYQQAIETLQPHLAYLVEEAGAESFEVGRLFHLIGRSYVGLGDMMNASDYLACAGKIFEGSGGSPSFGSYSANASLVAVYLDLGNTEKALEYAQKGLEIIVAMRGERHPFAIDSWQSIARVYVKMGEFAKAQDALNRAESLIEPTQMTDGQKDLQRATYLSDYASLRIAEGEYPAAADSLQKMLVLCRKVLNKGNNRFLSIYNRMAEVLQAQGRCREAFQWYQQVFAEIGGKDSLALSQGNLSESVNYDQYLVETLLGQAEALCCLAASDTDGIRQLNRALEAYDLAFQFVERSRRGRKSGRFKNELASKSHEAFASAMDVCHGLYSVTKDGKYLELAFSFMEQSKSISFRESLVDARAKKFGGIPDSILRQERRLQLAVYQAEERLIESKQSRDADALEREFFDSKRTYESFVDDLKARFPKYHTLKYRTTTSDIDQVRRYLLAPDRALIEYFLSDSTLAAFVIARDTLVFAVTTIDTSFADMIHELRNAIITRDYEAYVNPALTVYQLVLAPYADILKAEELIVIPDGELSLLPFEALLRRPPTNPNRDFSELDYVIYEHSISYGISATLLVDAAHQTMNFADFSKTAGFAPAFEIN